uniref:Protein TSSC1 n=1 Tax=Ascaris suum TaxID=6253 RepID=F1LA09_ASCSU
MLGAKLFVFAMRLSGFYKFHNQEPIFLSSLYNRAVRSVEVPLLRRKHSGTLLCRTTSLLQHFRLNDERLEKVEEHEDSVYACAWAGNDPWVFASLSFDGRVIVSRVKRHHKYAILQL